MLLDIAVGAMTQIMKEMDEFGVPKFKGDPNNPALSQRIRWLMNEVRTVRADRAREAASRDLLRNDRPKSN
jgi:hypothetical protein